MSLGLTIIFFEDYFTCSILPNENSWETIRINGEEKILLYFYCNGDDIRNDVFARERFEAGDPNAWGNFYEKIEDNSFRFTRFELEWPLVHLLRDALDQLKKAYCERISRFYSNYTTASEIDVNLCFIPGIAPGCAKTIRYFFVQNGFRIHSEADYFEAWLHIYRQKGLIPEQVNLALVDSCFGDLYFHYVEYDGRIMKKEYERLTNKGIDHRVGNLARLLVEKAGRQSHSPIIHDKTLFEKEIRLFYQRAQRYLGDFVYNELNVLVELSDFSKARVIINSAELEQLSQTHFQFIQFRFSAFISRYANLERMKKVLLNGDALQPESVISFFQQHYGASKIIKPVLNFTELLSRGIAGLAPGQSLPPVFDSPPRPPLPPLPPASGTSKKQKGPPPPPPLPPKKNK